MRIWPRAAFATSALLHAAVILGLDRLPPPRPAENVAVEVMEVPPAPPPPAPVAQPDPPQAPPRAPSARVEPTAPVRAPRRFAPPREAPVAPAPDPAPPPPNAPPPDDAKPVAQAPVRIGVAMSATTESGTVAAPTGNTLYGDMPKRAPDPEEVAAYRADRYVPPTRVLRLPTVVTCDVPKSEYPQAAYRAGIEGRVRLRLLVGADGQVLDARVVEEPGHGLGSAAANSVRRHCRFRPAEGPDGPAATWITYSVRFEID